jgi:hypothetical protein
MESSNRPARTVRLSTALIGGGIALATGAIAAVYFSGVRKGLQQAAQKVADSAQKAADGANPSV